MAFASDSGADIGVEAQEIGEEEAQLQNTTPVPRKLKLLLFSRSNPDSQQMKREILMAALNCGAALWSWGQKTAMLTQIVLRLNQLAIFQNSHGEGLLNVNCLRLCIMALLHAVERRIERRRPV